MAIFSPTVTYLKPQPFPTFNTENSSSLPSSVHPPLRLLPPPSPLCTTSSTRVRPCHAALSPPPPPQSDPPPEKDPQEINNYEWTFGVGRRLLGFLGRAGS
ncbi:unnamed protein product [Dovyalis caffra]|uniref:Uncharacterized protein n=1 Tax=Dovyalis caffra TaxID=77055 RepID=A0AAV1STD6_9ROSI|nr:unnamed protein product [Dovyalis caffra]